MIDETALRALVKAAVALNRAFNKLASRHVT